jgi:hypothetical protein
MDLGKKRNEPIKSASCGKKSSDKKWQELEDKSCLKCEKIFY